MSFGDKRLDKAFDEWVTRSPAEEPSMEECYDEGYIKGPDEIKDSIRAIMEYVKETERDYLAKLPDKLAIQKQTAFLEGYANCWTKIYEKLKIYEIWKEKEIQDDQ